MKEEPYMLGVRTDEEELSVYNSINFCSFCSITDSLSVSVRIESGKIVYI